MQKFIRPGFFSSSRRSDITDEKPLKKFIRSPGFFTNNMQSQSNNTRRTETRSELLKALDEKRNAEL